MYTNKFSRHGTGNKRSILLIQENNELSKAFGHKKDMVQIDCIDEVNQTDIANNLLTAGWTEK